MKIKDIKNLFNDKDDVLMKNIIVAVIVFLIFHYSYIFQYIPIVLFKFDVSSYNSTLNVIVNCFSNFILMFILMFIYREDLKKEWKKFKDNFWDNINIGFTAWFFGLLIMLTSNFIIRFFLGGGTAQNEQAVQSMIHTIPVLMIINAGILSPFNEELVFRKTLKEIFKNKYVFMFVSFLIFGGVHVFNSDIKAITDLLFIIPYGSLGAAFAYMYYETDTVFTSMSLHMFHNVILIFLSLTLMLF